MQGILPWDKGKTRQTAYSPEKGWHETTAPTAKDSSGHPVPIEENKRKKEVQKKKKKRKEAVGPCCHSPLSGEALYLCARIIRNLVWIIRDFTRSDDASSYVLVNPDCMRTWEGLLWILQYCKDFYPKCINNFARLLHELSLCHWFSSNLVYTHSVIT